MKTLREDLVDLFVAYGIDEPEYSSYEAADRVLTLIASKMPEKLDPLDVGALTGPKGVSLKEALEVEQLVYMTAYNAAITEVKSILKGGV